MNGSLGLVLSGGGGKGAYEIGVWKALNEFGMDQKIGAVAGTSIGALNAALFLQGDIELAERVWLSISPEKILTINPALITRELMSLGVSSGMISYLAQKAAILSGYGVFSREGLLQIIRESINLTAVSSSTIPFYATCCTISNVVRQKATYFQVNGCDEERITSILLASSAIPGIFPPENINGDIYWDGFLVDNTPIEPLYHHGCNLIIAVHLDGASLIDHDRYPNAQIIEIIPQEDLGGAKGSLDFTASGAKKRMEQGYQDTKRILEPVLNMVTVQKKMMDGLERLKQSESQFREKREDLLSERDRLKQELQQYLS